MTKEQKQLIAIDVNNTIQDFINWGRKKYGSNFSDILNNDFDNQFDLFEKETA